MKIFSYFSKKVTWALFLGVIIVIVLIFSFSNGNGKERIFVSKRVVIQEVSASGKVKPNQSVNLGFDKSGRVANVFASVGDMVSRGERIASLEAGDIGADVAKARALLDEEIIKLRELENTTPISYGDAYKNLEASLREGVSSADNAVRNRADQFFTNSPSNPQFEVSFTDGNFVHYFNVPSSLVTDINNQRREIEIILVNWQNKLMNLDYSDPSKFLKEADLLLTDLKTISNFLDRLASAINTFAPAEYDYETTVNTYKTTISSARTEVSNSISSIVTAKDKLNSAPILGQSGEFENVLAQKAKVAQAKANLASFEAVFSKTSILAPFDGIITIQDVKVGETISAGTPLVSISSKSDIYIEANISEINIGKISENNRVIITFDAFPGEYFNGFVSNIEPGDFLIDGVVNYKIRVELEVLDSRIKNGLTANLKIETAKKENVLAIPLYAVFKENDQNFVNKIMNNKSQKTEVGLGLLGSNGLVEVINGLNEGDLVEF